MMAWMWSAIDLALRFVYVAAVPFLLPMINLFMPITAMLIGAGLATTIALIGSDYWYDRVHRIRFVGGFLANMGKLGDFYRQYPPKPLLYYVLYPVLLPVILVRRVPRREFLLFRKMNVIALLIVVATGAWDFFVHWRPELTFGEFLGATVVVMVMQMIVMFMFIMPIVTTLVIVRERHHVRTLVALVALMLASASYGAYTAHRAHAMSLMTWLRLEQRTKYARLGLIECEMAHPDRLESCLGRDPELRAMAHAVRAAHVATSYDEALAAAHDKLRDFYKDDEASAFRLVRFQDTLVLFARYGRNPAIWLGYANGHYTIYPHQLPPRLRVALNL
jgi:hypothetical protein